MGVFRIDGGSLTTGELVGVAYLFTLLTFPIQFMGFMLWEMAGSLAGWQRVSGVLAADEVIPYGSIRARENGRAAAGGP